jgi:hypothetical protein
MAKDSVWLSNMALGQQLWWRCTPKVSFGYARFYQESIQKDYIKKNNILARNYWELFSGNRMGPIWVPFYPGQVTKISIKIKEILTDVATTMQYVRSRRKMDYMWPRHPVILLDTIQAKL